MIKCSRAVTAKHILVIITILFKSVLQESCNQFQAGSNLRSKIKSKKLDETALFGAGCRHEVPLKFFSLKRGEECVDVPVTF